MLWIVGSYYGSKGGWGSRQAVPEPSYEIHALWAYQMTVAHLQKLLPELKAGLGWTSTLFMVAAAGLASTRVSRVVRALCKRPMADEVASHDFERTYRFGKQRPPLRSF